MDNKPVSPFLLLSSIGVPYSLSEDLLTDILPELALCLASPAFYKDAKSCNLTYALLKANYDLFYDDLLCENIKNMNDKLAIAFLGGILAKANRNHFASSIELCKTKSKGADVSKIEAPLRMLAEMKAMNFDQTMIDFGIHVNEIKDPNTKKTTPRESLSLRNSHFKKRMNDKSI